MKYLLLHTLDESRFADTEAGGAPDGLDVWINEMVARGVILDGARLRPVSDATTVRVTDGRTIVTDGPFAETKEQIAGYDVLECPDLDTAVAAASAHPTLNVGSIEVRPFDPGMPDPEVDETVAEGRVRYLMLVCGDMTREPAAESSPTPELADPPEAAEGDDDVDQWIADAGSRRLYGWPLDYPDTAVTLRKLDGRVVTTDGPFAETKEQIAGYDLLECSDLDDAIGIAAGHPVARVGVLELRPLSS